MIRFLAVRFALKMPVASLDHVSLAFGHLPLLDDVVLQIEPGERVALVGRNGSGKSTVLQILSGERAIDAGSVSVQPGLRIGRLAQDVPLATNRAVFDVVADGLGDISELVAAYHHAARNVAEGSTPAMLADLGELQHELEQRDGWRIEQRVELVLSRLNLPPEAGVDTLSGGWRRRVLLARALVAQPDLLLLDEPTNHLDLDAITWLEGFLADYPGAVVFVTHDRAFLQRLATRIVEIDRGRVTSWPGDYTTFVRRKEEWLADETTHREKFDKRLAEEEAWLRQGVKARRTRNEGRVKALMAMRQQRAARRLEQGQVRLQVERAERSGDIVFEADGITKAFGSGAVVRDFSVRVMRGDRIGLIGPNGAGKTTLLRLLLGELAPDGGDVRRGANVQVAYYDQQREQLDPERTVFDTVGDGNDTVTVNGGSRHVNAYLRDFLFPAGSGVGSRERRCRGASATGCCSRACSRDPPMSSSSTSPPTISISKHWNWSKRSSCDGRAHCSSSATIACSWTTSSRARSYSQAAGECRNTSAATTTGCGSATPPLTVWRAPLARPPLPQARGLARRRARSPRRKRPGSSRIESAASSRRCQHGSKGSKPSSGRSTAQSPIRRSTGSRPKPSPRRSTDCNGWSAIWWTCTANGPRSIHGRDERDGQRS
jgi:ATPase subunit of ABC transporter with duplicated ATPase domains